MKEIFCLFHPFQFSILFSKRETLKKLSMLQLCIEELNLYATDTWREGMKETRVAEEDNPKMKEIIDVQKILIK